MTLSLRARPVALLVMVLALCSATPAGAKSLQRATGDMQLFARLDYPGHPGGLAVDGRTLYISTSNGVFDRPFDGMDQIWAYDLDSRRPSSHQPNPIEVPRANPLPMHSAHLMGIMGLALDADGRIYGADMNGRIVRVDPDTGAHEVYATIPTNTNTSLTSMPTFLAFDDTGNLYVGDAAAPFIFLVPPGGGQAEVWFTDPRLAGTWGTNVLGLAIGPSGDDLYVLARPQASQIVVYRLPLADPSPGDLEEFHRYEDVVVMPCDPAADVLATIACRVSPVFGGGGLAFGASGRLYVSFLGKNQLSILEADGTEALRFPDPEENMERDVPLNAPFGLAFDGRGSLLVSNTGDPTWGRGPDGSGFPLEPTSSESWVVFDVFVDDTAQPLPRPTIA